MPGAMESGKDSIAGVASAVAQTIVGHPADTVKVRLQTSPAGRYTGPVQCLRSIVATSGIPALYRGATSMLVGQQLVNIVKFSVYQYCRRALDPEYAYLGSQQASSAAIAWHVPAAACMSGMINSFVLCPVELVKVRLQAQFLTEAAPSGCASACRSSAPTI